MSTVASCGRCVNRIGMCICEIRQAHKAEEKKEFMEAVACRERRAREAEKEEGTRISQGLCSTTEISEIADKATILTRKIAQSLLRPAEHNNSVWAEDKHPWMVPLNDILNSSVIDLLWDSTLMRTFDVNSGSYPNSYGRMLARDPRSRLYTELERKTTLATHADHRNWDFATPYISFTNSPRGLQELAEIRGTTQRGDQMIVVVDPHTRFELGLPVLNYDKEMDYYDIVPPYNARDYLQNHYLCLWEVTPEEVVGIWYWSELRSNANWYEKIVVPALQRYRRNRGRNEPQEVLHRHSNTTNQDSTNLSKDTDASDDNHKRDDNESLTDELVEIFENQGIN